MILQTRSMSTKVSRDNLKLLKNLYKAEGRFDSPTDLAEVLFRNVIHYKHKGDHSGLLVINKPAGVPLKTSNDGLVGLQEALPILGEKIGAKNISVIKSVQRFSSGIVLLGTKDHTTHQVKNSFNRAKHNRYFKDSYFAICYGISRKEATNETVDLQFEKIRDDSNPITGQRSKEPVISRTLTSRNQIHKRDSEITRVSVHSKVISRGHDGRSSLLRIEPTSTINSFVQIYANDLLCPIIGDHMYGYRTRHLLNKMVRVNPQKSPDPNAAVKNLPDWFLKKLGLYENEENLLPLHLHLGRVFLQDYLGKNNHLILRAPPPLFFQGTADCLGISLEKDVLFDDMDTRRYEIVNKKDRSKKEFGMEIIPPEESSIEMQSDMDNKMN